MQALLGGRVEKSNNAGVGIVVREDDDGTGLVRGGSEDICSLPSVSAESGQSAAARVVVVARGRRPLSTT